MKLAEFFISLGFDFSGGDDVKKLDKSLDDLAGNARKLLAVFAGATAGMATMLYQSLKTAGGFREFTAVTGLSSRELQKWHYIAEQTGQDANELTASIENLQQAQADIAMGRGNVAPWQLLGIAPSTNPFDTLRNIKEAIKDLDPAVARSVLGQMGLGKGMFAMLRLSNKEFEKLEANFLINAKSIDALNEINTGWAELLFQLKSITVQLVAELAPALKPVLDGFKKLLLVGGMFVNWLQKGTVGAKIMKGVIIGVAAAIVIGTVALTALVGVLGLLAAAIALVDIAASPLLPVIWAFTAVVLVAGAVIAAAVLLVEDLWVAMNGGQSVIGEMIKKFALLKVAIAVILGPLIQFMALWKAFKGLDDKKGVPTGAIDPHSLDKLKNAKSENEQDVDKARAELLNWKTEFINNQPAWMREFALPKQPSNTNNTSTIKQENNVEVNVSTNSDDPYKVGRAVADPLKKTLSDFTYQLPLPA